MNYGLIFSIICYRILTWIMNNAKFTGGMQKMKIKLKRAAAAIMAALTLSAVTASSVVFTASASDLYAASVSQNTATSNIIPLNNDPITLVRGETYSLPQSLAKTFPNVTFRIRTTNTSILHITNNTVTAYAAGSCKLIITGSNGVQVTKNVKVELPEIQIKFSTSNVIVGKSETVNINNLLTSATGKVEWTSSNSSVVSVNRYGRITALKPGIAVITGTIANGDSSSCKFTVKETPKSVSFEKNKIEFGVGENTTLKAVLSSNSASYNTTYSSIDPKVLSIDSKTGEIHALKAGKTVISVKTFNNLTAKCIVEVKNPPNSVSLNIKETTLKKGQTITLKPVFPSGTTSNQMSYYSSNNRIVKVSNNGVVTAVAKGTAYIAAQTYNNKIVKCKITVK